MRPSAVMTTEEELLIIDRILAGEQSLYAELVDRYKSYAFTIAFRILNNRADAEEAAQDAFIKVFHHLGGFNRQAKFSTWLYRIVFNTAISYRRKYRATHHSIDEVVVAYNPDAEKILETADKRKYLLLAMEKLGEADRTALTLYYLKELSLDEIAQATGLENNTIKVRIHRARIKLADEMKSILKQEAIIL